jgi:hypothetical protein
MSAEFVNFAVTYGADPACQLVALGNNVQTPQVIDSYLNDVLVLRQNNPQTLYARLATSCGSSAEASGWPATARNNFGVVLFEHGAQHVAKQDPSRGSVDLGAIDKGIAFTQGRYELADLNSAGSGHRIVDVAGGGATMLQQWPPASTASQASLPAASSLPQDYLCTGSYALAKQPKFGTYPANGPGRGRTVVPVQPALFATTAAAVVDATAPANTCSEECWHAVARVIARSIAGWRGACDICKSEALVALDIFHMKFVDSRALEALRAGALEIPHKGAPPPGTNPLQQSALITPFDKTYVEMAPMDPEICGMGSRLADWRSAIRAVVCANPVTYAGAGRIHVQFVAGPLKCDIGQEAATVACATVDEGVQVSLVNLQYRWRDPRTSQLFTMGQGPEIYDLQYVLLHEIGHWMGLTDIVPPDGSANVKKPIMADTYVEAGACISASETSFLAAASDLTWTGRLTSCSGLRRPSRLRQP